MVYVEDGLRAFSLVHLLRFSICTFCWPSQAVQILLPITTRVRSRMDLIWSGAKSALALPLKISELSCSYFRYSSHGVPSCLKGCRKYEAIHCRQLIGRKNNFGLKRGLCVVTFAGVKRVLCLEKRIT